MPRNKAKVKNRKVAANKGARANASQPQGSVEDVLRKAAVKKPCSHGFCVELHPLMPICGQFVDAFIGAYGRNICSDANPKSDMITAMNAARKDTQNKIFYSVWSDEFKMKWIMSYFVAKASDYVLEGKDEFARSYAMFANHFEQTIAVANKEQAEITAAKMAELINGDMNTVVKYLRQRICCDCLDKKYQEVKSITKQGFCCNPGCSLPSRMVERKKMLRCTQCGESNYCSRECQVAHWPYHKEGCRKFAENQAKCHRVKQSKQPKCNC